MLEKSGTASLTDFLSRLNKAQSSVLMLDYDGTLAPFQTERDQAYPYPGVLPLLQEILRRNETRIVIVTGRAIHEVQALLAPLTGFEIWGAHGLEHLLVDGTRRQAAIDPEIISALDQASSWLRSNGMASLVETKPGGVAVHWRGLSETEIEKVESDTQAGWADLARHSGLKLLRFDGGLELRVTRPNKGDAVTAILKDLPPNTPVAFLGDDLTDEDGFRILADRGLSVLVRDEYRETQAKAWIKPPQELLGFFEEWLRQTQR